MYPRVTCVLHIHLGSAEEQRKFTNLARLTSGFHWAIHSYALPTYYWILAHTRDTIPTILTYLLHFCLARSTDATQEAI